MIPGPVRVPCRDTTLVSEQFDLRADAGSVPTALHRELTKLQREQIRKQITPCSHRPSRAVVHHTVTAVQSPTRSPTAPPPPSPGPAAWYSTSTNPYLDLPSTPSGLCKGFRAAQWSNSASAASPTEAIPPTSRASHKAPSFTTSQANSSPRHASVFSLNPTASSTLLSPRSPRLRASTAAATARSSAISAGATAGGVHDDHSGDQTLFCETTGWGSTSQAKTLRAAASTTSVTKLPMRRTSPVRLRSTRMPLPPTDYCCLKFPSDGRQMFDEMPKWQMTPSSSVVRRMFDEMPEWQKDGFSPAPWTAVSEYTQRVCKLFTDHYYYLLYTKPEEVFRFYHDSGRLSRPEPNGAMSSVTTLQGIAEKIRSFHHECMSTETEVEDVQELPEGGIRIQVTGCLVRYDYSTRNFAQSFVLTPQVGDYFVLSDVFRYVDEHDPREAPKALKHPVEATSSQQHRDSEEGLSSSEQQSKSDSKEPVSVVSNADALRSGPLRRSKSIKEQQKKITKREVSWDVPISSKETTEVSQDQHVGHRVASEIIGLAVGKGYPSEPLKPPGLGKQASESQLPDTSKIDSTCVVQEVTTLVPSSVVVERQLELESPKLQLDAIEKIHVSDDLIAKGNEEDSVVESVDCSHATDLTVVDSVKSANQLPEFIDTDSVSSRDFSSEDTQQSKNDEAPMADAPGVEDDKLRLMQDALVKESLVTSLVLSEISGKVTSMATESNCVGSIISGSISGPKDRGPMEQTRPKSSAKKKQKKELWMKADVAGTTFALYNAYKGSAEKKPEIVAAGVILSPFEYDDVVTITAHPSLHGPRGAMIFFRKVLKEVNKQGNSTSIFSFDSTAAPLSSPKSVNYFKISKGGGTRLEVLRQQPELTSPKARREFDWTSLVCRIALNGQPARETLTGHICSTLKEIDAPAAGYEGVDFSCLSVILPRPLLLLLHVIVNSFPCPFWLLLHLKSILRQTTCRFLLCVAMHDSRPSRTSPVVEHIMGESGKDLSFFLCQLVGVTTVLVKWKDHQILDMKWTELCVSLSLILDTWKGKKAVAINDLIIEMHILRICWETLGLSSVSCDIFNVNQNLLNTDIANGESFFHFSHAILIYKDNLSEVVVSIIHQLSSAPFDEKELGWDLLRNGSWISFVASLLDVGIGGFVVDNAIPGTGCYYLVSEKLEKQLQLVIISLNEAIYEADGFQNTHQRQQYASAKFSIDQVVFILEKVRIFWDPLLLQSPYKSVMCKVLDSVFSGITAGILELDAMAARKDESLIHEATTGFVDTVATAARNDVLTLKLILRFWLPNIADLCFNFLLSGYLDCVLKSGEAYATMVLHDLAVERFVPWPP